jgi:hypothetical protein
LRAECGQYLWWRTELVSNKLRCPQAGGFIDENKNSYVDDTGFINLLIKGKWSEALAFTDHDPAEFDNTTYVAPIRLDKNSDMECLARTLAHEALHRAYYGMNYATFAPALEEGAKNLSPAGRRAHRRHARLSRDRSFGWYLNGMDEEGHASEENYTKAQTNACFFCEQ